MALLPIPPSTVTFIDPITGGVNIQWQNFLQSIQSIGGTFAPPDARYWVSTANGDLTNETNLGAVSSGYLKLTTAAGVGTPSTVTAIPASDLSGTVPVGSGGTGDTTLTAHGVLIGNGTGAVATTAAGASNTVLHGNTGADPTYSAVSLTADVTGTLPVANGGTGDATLAAHGVLVGNGTSAVSVTGAGTARQVLSSNGASADPTFQEGICSLLKFNSGTDANTGATTVDTLAISGLTVKDLLKIYITMSPTAQALNSGSAILNTTDSVTMFPWGIGEVAGEFGMCEIWFVPDQQSSKKIIGRSLGWASTFGVFGVGYLSTFTTDWTGSWTLGLQSAGVTAGGTNHWSWRVFKFAGQ